MNNKEIAGQFSLLSKLMDIHGENSFRSKNYSIAAYKIEKLSVNLQDVPEKDIVHLPGIGETNGKKIQEILSTGKMEALENLISKTPEGIFEIMKIKGLGPKKINLIWKEMEIENIGELLYACNENRLLNFKGFGKKTQDNVIEAIEFYMSQLGSYLFAQVEILATELRTFLENLFAQKDIALTGEMLRQGETIQELEYVIPLPIDAILEKIKPLNEFQLVYKDSHSATYKYNNGINVKLNFCTPEDIVEKTFETIGSIEFLASFNKHFPEIKFTGLSDENEIFRQAGIQYIPPFLRETENIISVASQNKIPEVLKAEDIKGIIHCHSNWSDGVNTLEELADACIERGKEYLVISDHSKTAVYAQGLTEEKVRAQQELVDELNQKLYPFKIFKSIESDILNDGNLDYSDSILSTFDLVIASVHSNLKMPEEKAMSRVLKAIENPYTTILGHMTGRLLLSRPGFPLDYKKIIDACAANNVVIELNANPRRLDMRWQWLEYALSKNILISINPDSHSIPDMDKNRFGVLVAQKGMVTKTDNLSSFSLAEFEDFLKRK